MTTLNSIKARLEREVSMHAETRTQLDEMSSRLSQLQQLVDMQRAEREKLEHAVTSGSLPDDAKVGLSSSTLMSAPLSKPQTDVTSPPPPPVDVPPPPPPPGAPPPPGTMTNKKNIPKSKQPMKSFNWSKLPDSVIKTTIWQDIDDTRVCTMYYVMLLISICVRCSYVVGWLVVGWTCGCIVAKRLDTLSCCFVQRLALVSDTLC